MNIVTENITSNELKNKNELTISRAINVLITGGGSGIGFAIAKEYSKKNANIFLIGRNLKKLELAKQECKKIGAGLIEVFNIDIRDKDELKRVILQIDSLAPLDFIYVNAGVSAGTLNGNESEEQIKTLIDINVLGSLNTLHVGIEVMSKRKRGNIAVVSSVASFFSLPSAPTYSASKAFIRVYAEGLSILYRKTSAIKISVICPGFVKTGMTDVNSFKMPFLMEAETAAKKIVRSVEKGSLRFIFPLPMLILVKIAELIGAKACSAILAKLPNKTPL